MNKFGHQLGLDGGDDLTFAEKRAIIGKWLNGSDGCKLWDLMCGLRGPDSPSERDDMTSAQSAAAYKGRRARKFKTVEVIRQKAFNGVIGGSARHHDDDHILLPPTVEWDHFDRHMQRAADVLGIKIVTEGRSGKRTELTRETE